MIADLLPTEEQSMIRDSVAGFLADRLPVERLRNPAAAGGAAERACWADLAGLGLFGLGLPEAAGGVGYGLPEEMIAARELGRFLASPTVLATMLAAHLAADTPETVRALSEGRMRVAFAGALAEPSASGVEVHMIDARDADLLAAWIGDHAGLLPPAQAAERSARAAMDETISLERARLPGPFAPTVACEALARRAELFACAYLTGIAEATLAMAVDYARTRRQFDQPIGAFQAVKHLCADMAVRAEAACAQTFYAALALEAAEPDLGEEVAAARLIARRAAIENAKVNIQLHGAMGFTEEGQAHLFLKRAHVMANLNAALGADLARLRA